MSLMIAQRAEYKARARARDEERLRSGEVSAIDLQRENMPFRKLRRDKIGFMNSRKPKSVQFLSL